MARSPLLASRCRRAPTSSARRSSANGAKTKAAIEANIRSPGIESQRRQDRPAATTRGLFLCPVALRTRAPPQENNRTRSVGRTLLSGLGGQECPPHSEE